MPILSPLLDGLDTIDRRVFPADGSLHYVNWARTALEMIIDLEDLHGSTLLLPAFICQDSFAPLFARYEITPRFVDVHPRTFHIDIATTMDELESVDSVLYVHAFGLPASLKNLSSACAREDVILIEDCARATGATVDGRLAGSFGDHALYSLSKIAPIPKGGALLTTADPKRVQLERPSYDTHSLYAVSPAPITDALSPTYPHEIERRKLDSLTTWAFRRYVRRQFEKDRQATRRRVEYFRQGLEPEGFIFQRDLAGRLYPTAPVITPCGCDRDELAHYLSTKNVPYSVVWGHPWGKTIAGREFDESFPHAAHLTGQLLHLDVRAMNDDDVGETIDVILEFLEMFGTA